MALSKKKKKMEKKREIIISHLMQIIYKKLVGETSSIPSRKYREKEIEKSHPYSYPLSLILSILKSWNI